MTHLILKIYDYMRTHILQCMFSFCIVTIVLLLLITRLDFKEDISAFLPLDGEQQEIFQVYQDVSGANKLIAIFQCPDSTNTNQDEIIAAVDEFSHRITEADSTSMITEIVTQIDMDAIMELTDFIYHNIPYFLTDADYIRIDSLLSDNNYLRKCMETHKQMLMFPTSNLLISNIEKDPLNLFSPIVAKLNHNADSKFFESYNGYIFTYDLQRCLVVMTSPFGNSETQKNSELMHFLENIATDIESRNSNIDVHFIGGPSIAVGNASQIKKDSVISIAIAVVLISLLMFFAFKNIRNIMLIAISIMWGWIFALGSLALFHNNISLIVIGISSIILGIAVNYPLHLISHSSHTSNIRQALREIISPLIIGNITTVGAFMALIPLKSTALKDLGLFSALLLTGTILFVIIYLPHAVKTSVTRDNANNRIKGNWIVRISNLNLENSKWGVGLVIILTGVFTWFSFQTKFDSNMSHINYMTEEQHQDMDFFQQLTSGTHTDFQRIYVVSKGKSINEALTNNHRIQEKLKNIASEYHESAVFSCADFFIPHEIQAERIERWNSFVKNYHKILTKELSITAMEMGFQPNAFETFSSIIDKSFSVKPFEYFSPLHSVYASNFSFNGQSNNYRVVSAIIAKSEDSEKIKNQIHSIADENYFCFDVQGMNSALANNLSDNFNYIGWACGFIVFMFLWFSFGNIELAIISFIPMAVSWIWILGIMGLTGIQFNIVNIILATFIFGQGDDYTIFMTEGCCYEYAYRRKMLASYKNSIIISALIMFIGIGTLIFSKHPALHSLAEVTIVGMFSVVLMAYMLPPLIFKWIVSTHGQYRRRPLTIIPLLRTIYCGIWWFFQLILGYTLGVILFVGRKRNKEKDILFRKFVTLCHKIDLHMIPGVNFTLHNPTNEDFSKPCILVCNHQSMLDPMFFMALSHKILIVANERSSMNPVIRIMFEWLGFYTIRNSNFTAWKDSSLERDLDTFKNYVNDGYSIAIFPEGIRNPDSSILRYHKGSFYLAEELGLDIVPVFLHGVNNIMPKGSFACHKGNVNMHIGKRINSRSELWGKDYSETTRLIHKYITTEYTALQKKYETTTFFIPLLLDRYRYKGAEVMATIQSNLKKYKNYSEFIDKDITKKTICINNSGYGEMPLLFALVHSDKMIIAYEEDPEKTELAKYAADGVVQNLKYVTSKDNTNLETNNIIVYDWNEL